MVGVSCPSIFPLCYLWLHQVATCIINKYTVSVGVSLKLGGVTIPSDSLVDVDDIMYTAPNTQCCSEPPSNTNPRDEALLCVTDLVDCCESPRTVRGDWYYPDGRIVEYNPPSSAAFQANRGPHEEVNGQQFYGTVRLFRRYSALERGRFHCELPRAADPSINQTIYANIGKFITYHDKCA